MGCVEIRGISKLFGNVRAVDHVDLATNEGEFLAGGEQPCPGFRGRIGSRCVQRLAISLARGVKPRIHLPHTPSPLRPRKRGRYKNSPSQIQNDAEAN